MGFGDYTSDLYKAKESFITVSQNHIDVEFSTSTKQHIKGVYDSRGMSGKVQLEISGPKSMINIVRMMETGIFETDLIIDKERIEEVISKVTQFGDSCGLHKEISEPLWRKLIDLSIEHEFKELENIQSFN